MWRSGVGYPHHPHNISCHITRRQTVFTEGIPAATGWSENLTVSPLNLTVAVGNVMLQIRAFDRPDTSRHQSFVLFRLFQHFLA